jgi:hypothetical protein
MLGGGCWLATSLTNARDSADSDAGEVLLFDEEFDGSVLDPNKWVVAGDGVWSIEGGTGIQSNGDALAAMIYARDFNEATDYHIVARMRSTGPFGGTNQLAPEIAFRVDPTTDAGGIPDSYHCEFNLAMSQLILDQTTPSNAAGFASVTVNVSSIYQATPFVLDAVVTGHAVTCTLTVDGLGSVGVVTTTMLTRPNGSFGLKTYDTTAQFFYFKVYATASPVAD